MQATLTGADLSALLEPLPSSIETLTRRLVAMIAAHPGLSGRVMRGWRSINFHHGKGGLVCAVFPYDDRVALYFQNGRMLDDTEQMLAGNGKTARYLSLLPRAEIPIDAIGVLIAEAIALMH
ncbi:DUF1801 domain-containing protein [Devosia sp.]|uniref:DUF1801 domain-containing protein n=1 Tax=Devosia sp. TaxID=1871048 RepID=UPI0032672DF5